MSPDPQDLLGYEQIDNMRSVGAGGLTFVIHGLWVGGVCTI